MSDPTLTTACVYECPETIARLFDTNKPLGRLEAVKWVQTLDLKIGDRVWLPEIGWHEYEGGEVGNA